MYSGFPQLATWTRTRASFALLAALGLLAPVAAAATTVSAFPTTNAVVTTGWTSPTAVYADDTTYATAAPGKNLTVSSDFGGFGFDSSVPSNATINSVTVEVGWGASTTASILTLTAQSYVSGVAAGTQLSDATAPTPIAVKTQLSTGFTRSQLLNGTFVVRVQAVQGGSNVAVTASLDYVKVTVDYSLPVAPSAPGAPIPSAVTESGLTATWTASATGTPAPTYTLQQGASSTGPWTNVTGCAGIAGTTCGVTGLTPNTTTWFQVVATNSAGSATSGVSSALTLPGQPALGAYTNVLSTSLTANWTLSGTTTGLTYTLQRGASSTGPFADVTGCVGIAATSCTDGTVAASTTYWYQVRALNATGGGAWSLSTSVTTAPPSNLEGDTAAGSNRPAVAIINPTSGTVGSWFKVQARVASPAGNVTGVTLYYNTASVAMTPSANYGTTATAGVWEYVFPALATGSYTLQVQATNASGSVFSRQVPITVVASGTGDGNLLVRDNASQLCADCHAVKSHSSETTSNTYGSWSLACRDCHTPHSTTNIFLVNQQITAPALTKAESPRSVTFYNRNGYVAGGMANPGNTGVCQVCHTRTQHYRQDGTLADHELTSNCSDCHTHVNGLKAKCTT
ncbi:MAG TPA: fibronectin type III domain-containing protein, partial [Anaeromyxobacteraceae bacterium]|nr:fibronectin type III domain-containing protein [Anaeromyxobacteraceae bacterium]